MRPHTPHTLLNPPLIASKPTHLPLIIILIPDRCLEDAMNDSPLKSVPQCYHWNHLKTHSYNGNVVSTTLEYNYINELQIT